jgi:pimeloyl-ACP methyl ester carboxylesterase
MNQSAADPKYEELRQAIEARGYKVIASPLHWNKKTVSEYTKEFIDFYKSNKGDEGNIVIGNSFGAMVAFLSAPIIKPDRVLVCSLSAYFKEDMHKQKQNYMVRRFGKRRTADSHIISADETAKKINGAHVPITFMRGEKENWGRFIKLSERVEQSAKAVEGSRLVIVPDCPHSFRTPEYIKGISAELDKF